MLKHLDLVYRTLFSELAQRCLDASFQSDYPPNANFVTVPVKGRNYWYIDITENGERKRRYVGPQNDPEITRRVEAFRDLKADLKGRRKLVSTLVREAGLAPPDRMTGDVVKAFADAGLFRLRGVLVGTVAFQCYPGLLGVRLPSTAMQTGDADFAQFHAVSAAVEDALPPVLDILRAVDPTFREVPHQSDGRKATQFLSRSRFKVEFLTPTRGSGELQGQAAMMPALGGASAQPLPFLDFLIYEPVRSVLLHGSGVPVTVPAPERYAVHKLIVATRRRADLGGAGKSEKDIRQATLLMTALIETRQRQGLALAFNEAWSRGPAWREALARGVSFIPQAEHQVIKTGLKEGLTEIGEDARAFDFLL